MNLTPTSVKFDIGGGREVTIETGKMARQADGSVTVRLGDWPTKSPKKGNLSSR